MFDASEHENSLNDLIRYVHDLEYGATARNSIHTNWILLVSQQWNKDLKTRCECGLENKLTQRYDMHFTHIFDAKMFYALVYFLGHSSICLSYCHSFQMSWHKNKVMLFLQLLHFTVGFDFIVRNQPLFFVRKTAKFGPKYAFLVILGQILAFFAHFVPCPTKNQCEQGA